MGARMKIKIRNTFATSSISAVLACACLIVAKTWLLAIASGFVVLILTALSYVLWRMSKLSPADSHTWRTLITQYLIFTLMSYNGERICRNFMEKCKNVGKTQAEVLRNILKTNQSTAYGRKYNFSEVTCFDDFVALHPLTNYDHYLAYIKVISLGEQNVLTRDKVVYLATSSGTTGTPKLIPVTQRMKGPTARYFGSLMYHAMKTKVGLDLGRVFVLSYKSLITPLPCGLRKGPVTGHMFRYPPYAVSPEEAFEIANEREAMHVHAVFALGEPDISHIEALLSTVVYSFWRYIERNWRSVCDDIERATLPDDIHADRDILVSLRARLTPNGERAAFLRRQFERGFGGIATRVWPRLRFVRMLTTGAFGHYADVLARHYMAGVEQLSLLHVASEGFFGANISRKTPDVTYTAMIEYAFFEYIPVESVEEEQPMTRTAEQVQLNKLYEIVITTRAGLYRYRTGDIVKIAGFCYQCPVYEYQYRLGQLLNLYWEKLPESVFYASVLQSVQELKNTMIVDYAATEDIHLYELRDNGEGVSTDLKHYVLFIEIEKENSDVILSEVDKVKFDDLLRHNFELYNTMRTNGSIGCMEVIQVKKGAFHRLKERVLEHTQSQQYKLPRVLRHKLHLKYLLSQDIRGVQRAKE